MNPAARKPPPLMPVLAEMNEAEEAISELQAQYMSAFGLPGIIEPPRAPPAVA